ncbi:hypothetical protein AAG570_005111 [Ranatra chinensis]|uniref:Uncharacterized protein n=1 Tax=Ranatra chinensis TaxID=642074 RepID=A0ABD0YLA3_9HEMI
MFYQNKKQETTEIAGYYLFFKFEFWNTAKILMLPPGIESGYTALQAVALSTELKRRSEINQAVRQPRITQETSLRILYITTVNRESEEKKENRVTFCGTNPSSLNHRKAGRKLARPTPFSFNTNSGRGDNRQGTKPSNRREVSSLTQFPTLADKFFAVRHLPPPPLPGRGTVTDRSFAVHSSADLFLSAEGKVEKILIGSPKPHKKYHGLVVNGSCGIHQRGEKGELRRMASSVELIVDH